MKRTLLSLALLSGVAFSQQASSEAEALLNKGYQLADQTETVVIEMRRYLHEHPELPYQEVNTAQYIVDQLKAMPGFEIETGIAKTGVKAVLKGGKPGPVVALRADMDGLPVKEENNLPFKSLATGIWEGKEVPVMHACGHDAHVAMLLGAAKVFSEIQDELPGTVVLLFQPAEEQGPGNNPPSGANMMMNEGVLDSPQVDIIFGQHIFAGDTAGTIHYREGSLMASGDSFKIIFEGTGGHGSSPWASQSPLIAAAETVVALNNIVAQNTNPIDGTTVVTVGKMESGTKMNILPSTAYVEGTVRSLSTANQEIAHALIQKYSQNIADNHGVSANVEIATGYNVVENDPDSVAIIAAQLDRAADLKGAHIAPPLMGSEDFGAFSRDIPSVFWFLNASPYEDKPGAANHSPEFMIDESALRVGVRAFVGSTLEYMNKMQNQVDK